MILVASCESDADRAEKNHQQLIADETACSDELAHQDPWSTMRLSARCQRVANIHSAKRKHDDAVAEQKAQQRIVAEDDERDHAAGAKCDAKARDKRDRWFTSRVTEGKHTSSPQDEGYRIDGRCDQKITHNALDCSHAGIVSVFLDDPWTQEAAHLGFTRFVCNEVDHLSKAKALCLNDLSSSPSKRL